MSAPVDPTRWVTSEQVAALLGADAPAPDDADGQARLDNSIDVASEVLYSLSGRQFPGEIPAMVRPTSRPAQITDVMWATRLSMYSWGNGYNADWLWGVCAGCLNRGCCGPYMIGLGRSPLISIEEVTIDAGTLDSGSYRIDDGKWLVRQDSQGWPTCQDLGRPIGDPCTFSVSFTFGQAPPKAGENAAALLASEAYKSQTPSLAGSCKLPSRISSITRQGVSMAVLDPMSFMKDGFTGIYAIDLFIRAYNPSKQIRKPMVYSPDMANLGRRQTWPGGTGR